MVPDLMTIELPREVEAPRDARSAVERYAGLVGEDRVDDLRLLTSELVSNAVKYGGEGTLQMHVRRLDDRLRVEVVDSGSGFRAEETAEARDRADLDAVGGWGLPLVQALATDWGSFEGSTHVWFEFDVAGRT